MITDLSVREIPLLIFLLLWPNTWTTPPPPQRKGYFIFGTQFAGLLYHRWEDTVAGMVYGKTSEAKLNTSRLASSDPLPPGRIHLLKVPHPSKTETFISQGPSIQRNLHGGLCSMQNLICVFLNTTYLFPFQFLATEQNRVV